MLALFLTLALQSADHQAFEPFPPTPFDRVYELTLDDTDAELAGHGHSERVTYKVEFSGTLHVWTKVEGDVDLFVRVETPSGELVQEDNDSGGGKTPYVKLEVETGRELVLVAALAIPNGSPDAAQASKHSTKVHRPIELHAVAAFETPESTAVAEELEAMLPDIERLHASNELQAARELAHAASEFLASPQGVGPSERVAAVTWELGCEAHSRGDRDSTSRFWLHAFRHRLRTLPDEHAELQKVRQNQAIAFKELGDFEGARALESKVLEVRSRTLPDDHPDLQAARSNLACTLGELGDLRGACELFQKAVDLLSRTRPEEDLSLLAARMNLAATIGKLGDFRSARALFEKVLEVCSRTLPDEHPGLQMTRMNLANTLTNLGDAQCARSLQEKVLEVYTRTMPEEHLELQKARLSLAKSLAELGDLQAARPLEEIAVESLSRTLPDEHPILQVARSELARTIMQLDDLRSALPVLEKVLEVQSRTLPDDHPDLQFTRRMLAVDLQCLGELSRARVLFEKVLEVTSRILPEEAPQVVGVRENLAMLKWASGDVEGARALLEKVVDALSRVLPDEHRDLQQARQNLAIATADRCARVRNEGVEGTERDVARRTCADLGLTLCRAEIQAVRSALLANSSREIEDRCSRPGDVLRTVLSLARGYGVFAPIPELERPAFELSEFARGVGLASARLTRAASSTARYDELRAALLGASDELVAMAQRGTTGAEFDTARRKREAAERALIELTREYSGLRSDSFEVDLGQLSARLGERSASVAFRRYTDQHFELRSAADGTGTSTPEEVSIDRMLAFVVRGGAAAKGESALEVVDLGAIEPIESAVRGWRAAIGTREGRGLAVASTGHGGDSRAAGERLRRLVIDPLLPAIGERERVVLVLDDQLHLVAFDALPLDAEGTLLGDRWKIETRATLGELSNAVHLAASEIGLLAIGGVSYDRAREKSSMTVEPAPSIQVAGILRGGAWSGGFRELPATKEEVVGIAAEFTNAIGASTTVLTSSDAERARLLELAPKARFLHIATHGWFAPESIRSWADPRPIDEKTGLGRRMSGEEHVRGMSPMLLCGLALAGANLPENELGRAPGLVTADELAALDLTHCELAVLSACDTARGEMRRTGQGVASLQRALQMAGARTVITSLWKVPDEATRELMLDFYRRLWVEKKPKGQALWEAKTGLRNAKDERGEPKYTPRDWAAWVLTGEPD